MIWSARMAYDTLFISADFFGYAGEIAGELERRGRKVGSVVSASGLVGLAVAPILTTQVAAHFGWRGAFFIAGVPGLILGLVIWKFMREPGANSSGSTPRGRIAPSAPALTGLAGTPPPSRCTSDGTCVTPLIVCPAPARRLAATSGGTSWYAWNVCR